jgi:methanogenic corrinoid protein MtbC1
MIRWCCYCQKLLPEKPPLTSFDISHGVCEACGARLEAGEPLEREHSAAIELYREIFVAARDGDERTCAALARRAEAEGFRHADILIGLIQPALAEIGYRWELGAVSAADEHRFTAWCSTMLALLEPPPAAKGDLDLLIVQAPGNRHELGPRIAERVLLASGIRALAVVGDLPLADIVSLTVERRPRALGISCALPHMIAPARELSAEVVARGFRGDIIVSGQAVRRAREGWPGAVVCQTVEEAREHLAGGRAASGGIR